MIRAALSSFVFVLAAAVASAHDVLVPTGSVWKFDDTGVDLGTAWRDATFDDSLWSAGPAQLGYGDGDEQTVVSYGPDPQNKYVTTYFRRAFTVANPTSYTNLGLRLLRDDGAAVFINGVEVARSNLDPALPLAWGLFATEAIAGGDESLFTYYLVPAGVLVAGTNVIAVELHQSSAASSDVSFDLELVGQTSEVLLRGPYLNLATRDSVVVRWRTDLPVASRVAYGATPGSLGFVVDDPAPVVEHEVAIGGLAPGTRYYYSVGSPTLTLAPPSTEQFFATAPAPGSSQPFRAWVVGDGGKPNGSQLAVRDGYAAWSGATATDLWLLLGDNAYETGSDEDYQRGLFDRFGAMLAKSPVWSARGNHETLPGVYAGIFTLPSGGEAGGVPSGTEAYYSFDWGDAHFVCLDSEGSDRSVGGAMHAWLQADLAASAGEWLIAFWHHPPYSKGSHDSDVELELVEMREHFLPLLESYGVDLVLCGHSHDYERSFLLDGHYGLSTTLAPSMVLDAGSGDPASGGAYNKGQGPHRGAVYCVTGSASKVGGAGALDHPAMLVADYRLGSLALDVAGGRLEATFVDAAGAARDRFVLLHPSYSGTYCVAKPNSAGCLPAIAGTGSPSASSPLSFDVTCAQVLPGKVGLLLYAYSAANTAFSGGRLCLAPPIRRTPGQPAAGAGTCGGSYALDFNARIRSGVDPALVPGASVDAQWWSRDPQASFGAGLSDALQFTIGN